MKPNFTLGQLVTHPCYGIATITAIFQTDYGFALQVNHRFSDYETQFKPV